MKEKCLEKKRKRNQHCKNCKYLILLLKFLKKYLSIITKTTSSINLSKIKITHTPYKKPIPLATTLVATKMGVEPFLNSAIT
jgi:hypothetical protein